MGVGSGTEWTWRLVGWWWGAVLSDQFEQVFIGQIRMTKIEVLVYLSTSFPTCAHPAQQPLVPRVQ